MGLQLLRRTFNATVFSSDIDVSMSAQSGSMILPGKVYANKEMHAYVSREQHTVIIMEIDKW